MQGLQTRFLRFVYSTEGRQADLILIEPNGDEHLFGDWGENAAHVLTSPSRSK